MTGARRSTPEASGPVSRRFTLVSFHAHPDDESLLTGGTLAKAAAEGHRVVLVTATAGERGLAAVEDGEGATLARLRLGELSAAATALGVHRVVSLGYGDSGLRPDPGDTTVFAHAGVGVAAVRLAAVLREEQADVLTIYDAHGGYGHPDHIQVHHVGIVAARLANTPVVLEATVPAGLFRAALFVLRAVGNGIGSSAPLGTRQVFSNSRDITHRVRVSGFLGAKRAAMAAHGTQRRAEGRTRVLDYFLRLPSPAFELVFGHEWFIEHGRDPAKRVDDVFATLRGDHGGSAPRPAAAPRPET
jgi:LmbE family N-acetylglucosaminyl deacetylase